MFDDKEKNICKPCSGTGVQVLKSGIKINCPVCGGTGKHRKPSETKWRIK